MGDLFKSRLFVLKIASNHMGNVEHDLHVMRDFGPVRHQYPYRFAIKLQYLQLGSLIHPSLSKAASTFANVELLLYRLAPVGTCQVYGSADGRARQRRDRSLCC